jgi:uncharacterized caspase-like protein
VRAAIVIGCGEFDDPEIGPLKYAAADASSLAMLLQETCDITEDSIFRAYATKSGPAVGIPPSRAGIIRALTGARQHFRGRALELLILFFSGHGFHSGFDRNDYLLTSDSVVADLEATALSFSAVEKYLREIDAKYTVLFLDACRAISQAGKSAESNPKFTPFRTEAEMSPGMVTFFSCKAGQLSFESDDCQHGLFTYCLLKGLGEEGHCTSCQQYRKHSINLAKTRFHVLNHSKRNICV